MKKKIVLFMLPILSVALSSCGTVRKYHEHLDDYVATMKYHKDFNVLQLTDIHWDNNSSTSASKRYMSKLLAEVDKHIKDTQNSDAKIDLIEITGDLFMLANSYHVKEFVKFFEKEANNRGFMYTVIWGNHDRHGLYNPNWLAKQFKNAKHCIYIEQNDDLYGRSNFVINLTEDGTKESAATWQLANLDSGASFSETAISPFRDYDYIREDQTQWFIEEHDALGNNAPVIAYYHIPQYEMNTLYEHRSEYTNKFFKLEGFASNEEQKYASNFIDKARPHNLKGAFMGHAHNVDWTVDYDGITVGLGVKTGSELYFAHIDPNSTVPEVKEGLDSLGVEVTEKFDLIGASLVTLTDDVNVLDGNFDLEHLYFNERSANDNFALWVKW